MKQMKCEVCGNTEIIKVDDFFKCQACGCKYSLEQVQKLMVELRGTVEVSNIANVENLIALIIRGDEQIDTLKKLLELVPNDIRILFFNAIKECCNPCYPAVNGFCRNYLAPSKRMRDIVELYPMITNEENEILESILREGNTMLFKNIYYVYKYNDMFRLEWLAENYGKNICKAFSVFEAIYDKDIILLKIFAKNNISFEPKSAPIILKNKPCYMERDIPLYAALGTHDINIVEFLLKNGANPNVRICLYDSKGIPKYNRTILRMATKATNGVETKEMEWLLKQYGAKDDLF